MGYCASPEIRARDGRGDKSELSPRSGHLLGVTRGGSLHFAVSLLLRGQGGAGALQAAVRPGFSAGRNLHIFELSGLGDSQTEMLDDGVHVLLLCECLGSSCAWLRGCSDELLRVQLLEVLSSCTGRDVCFLKSPRSLAVVSDTAMICFRPQVLGCWMPPEVLRRSVWFGAKAEPEQQRRRLLPYPATGLWC